MQKRNGLNGAACLSDLSDLPASAPIWLGAEGEGLTCSSSLVSKILCGLLLLWFISFWGGEKEGRGQLSGGPSGASERFLACQKRMSRVTLVISSPRCAAMHVCESTTVRAGGILWAEASCARHEMLELTRAGRKVQVWITILPERPGRIPALAAQLAVFRTPESKNRESGNGKDRGQTVCLPSCYAVRSSRRSGGNAVPRSAVGFKLLQPEKQYSNSLFTDRNPPTAHPPLQTSESTQQYPPRSSPARCTPTPAPPSTGCCQRPSGHRESHP